ncbi:copper amine oxidase N-terminal domain-containing protein [bacterium]|nr:MAG: copper amine oxidase N-terminal domain-containing protein [bacterium]
MDTTGNAFDHNGTQYVAFKPIVERFGGTVEWDNFSKIASADLGGRNVKVGMSNSQILVDDALVNLGGKPYVEEDVLFVPKELFDHIGRPI